MNYRVLFFISFLILGVGIVGLLNFNSESPQTNKNIQTTEKPQYKTVVITTAVATKELKKGTLLQKEDYKLSNLSLNVLVTKRDEASQQELSESKEKAFDITPLLNQTGNSLSGFLVQENIASGSLINPHFILSPQDKAYVQANIDPTTEIAYVFPIKASESYLLTTLKSGSYISMYANVHKPTANYDEEKNDVLNQLIKLIDYVPILNIESEKTSFLDVKKDDYIIGTLVLKLTVKQLKQLYQVPIGTSFVVLPAEKPEVTTVNEIFSIRQLKGLQ